MFRKDIAFFDYDTFEDIRLEINHFLVPNLRFLAIPSSTFSYGFLPALVLSFRNLKELIIVIGSQISHAPCQPLQFLEAGSKAQLRRLRFDGRSLKYIQRCVNYLAGQCCASLKYMDSHSLMSDEDVREGLKNVYPRPKIHENLECGKNYKAPLIRVMKFKCHDQMGRCHLAEEL
jgi:hypothetical protein